MALEKTLIPVSFSQGIDTKTDPKQVIPGKLLELQNATLVSPMQLQKAPGYVALSRAILGDLENIIEEGQSLAVLSNEMLLASDSLLYSFTAATQSWVPKGTLLSTQVSQFSVDRSPTGDTSCDSAIHSSGLAIYAWTDADGVKYSVVDTNTGQLVVSSAVAEASPSDIGQAPKCLAFGSFLFVFFVDSTGGSLLAQAVAVSNPVNSSTLVTLSSTLETTAPTYDVCVGPGGVKLYYAWNDATAATTGVGYLTPNLIPATISVVSAGDAVGGLTIIPSYTETATLMVAYATATAVRAFTIDTLLVAVLADTLVETVSSITNVSGLWDGALGTLFYTLPAVPTYNNRIRTNTLTSAGVAGTASIVVRSLSLAGKPFVSEGVIYMLANYESGNGGIQNTYFLIDSTGIAVAKALNNGAGGLRADHIVAEVNSPFENPGQLTPLATQFQYACLVQTLLVSNVSVAAPSTVTTDDGVAKTSLFSVTGVESVTFDMFDPAVSYAKTVLADTLHITGGFLQMYDGDVVVEHGFHLWPEQLGASSAGGTGNTYSWVGVYEWTDAQGNKHQSSPSIPKQLTNIGPPQTNNVTITFPTLRVTAKENVVLAVYRTEEGGTQYFRVTDVTVPTLNSKTVDSVAIVDNVADTALIAGQNLYTFGGVVENVSPPAALTVNTFANRLWVLPSTNTLQPWYSKQVVPGTPAAFSDLFVLNLDPRGGAATAMAAMDANQIFFKESSIFAVNGDGPDDTGQQNTFSGPQLVATDCGCTDPRSVVLTPMGLMFKSAKGVYLLDRSLSVKYIGADVEDFNAAAVTSATLVGKTNQVRYNLDDGTQLVYDYYMNQWSTRPLLDVVDAVVLDDQYFYLESEGRVLAEIPGLYSIAGEGYPLRLRTSWLSLSGVSGLQRVYGAMLLGTWKSPHKLRVQVYYDFNDAAFDTYDIDAQPFDPGFWGDGETWGSGEVWGGLYPHYQFRINFTRQKCTAVQLVIEDLQIPGLLNVDGENAPPGEAYALSNLTFIAGMKQGWKKVEAARVYPATTP